ncbi:hypothetical protein J4230_01185 [Candidatus Woesearchaeota archaeon]|nr:hypothetical protein [Candidatus Woesearchaeota archaeon]
MINLEKNSGLKLFYNLKTRNLVSKTLFIPKVDIRNLNDMKNVLMDKESNGPKELYYMYRNIHMPEHRDIFSLHGMRYDITVMPPAFIGKEFNKTKGHHHKGVEIYEVLYGEALYIFETKKYFLVIHAKAGTRVYVPYEAWHVTINHRNRFLIMANLMPEGVPSNYKDLEKRHGMAYYYLNGNRFIPNKNFRKLPKITKLKAKRFKVPIYWQFIKSPGKLK